MNDETITVGDELQQGRDKALRAIAIGLGLLVYAGVVLYSGVHNWNLLTAGVPKEMVIWAAIGVVALELSALGLPLALHFWTHAPLQRLAAFAFYAVDIGLIVFNVILDFGYQVGTAAELPLWLQAYRYYASPISPMIVGVFWSILFLLDPSQQERAMIYSLRASVKAALARRISVAAKGENVTDLVDQAARDLVSFQVRAVLGAPAPRLPSRTLEGQAKDAAQREQLYGKTLQDINDLIAYEKQRQDGKNGRQAAKEFESETGDFLAGSQPESEGQK